MLMVWLMLAVFRRGYRPGDVERIQSGMVSETAINTTHDSFIAFFGVAIGMFRGMAPQGSIASQILEAPQKGLSVTTDTTVHSENKEATGVTPRI